MLSIVIPTYNEVENVKLLCLRIAKAMDEIPYEVVFVDDSTDATPEVLAELSSMDNRVRFHHRSRTRGLATAVVEGFKLAQGNYLAVMDADLQHPPELLPVMYKAVSSGADLLVPSRFIRGGSDGGLKVHRKLVSWTARNTAKVMLNKLSGISDPTGGFFMLRREVITGVHFNPVGWKILMEILIKGSYTKVVEIPYSFAVRAHNTSKMALKEQFNYLKHLGKLIRISPADRQFWQQVIREGTSLLTGAVVFAVIDAWLPEYWAVLLSAMAYIPANRLMNVSYGGRRYPFAPRRISFSLGLALLSSGIGGLFLLYLAFTRWVGLPESAAFILSSIARTGYVLFQAVRTRVRSNSKTTMEIISLD